MRRLRVKRWHVAVAASVGAVLATAGIAVAVVAGVTGSSGGSITAVKVVRGADATTTTSTSYVNLPGASTTIHVPSGQHALILARFSAESRCSGGSAGQYCTVKILIGGSSGKPATGSDFAFDSDSGAGNDWWESHSMDRSRVLGPGTWTVRVQYAVTVATTTFRLDDWSLTVERSQRS
jgi:hypothetical protein